MASGGSRCSTVFFIAVVDPDVAADVFLGRLRIFDVNARVKDRASESS